MDRQTLVNYGWIVIAALVIAIMLALATPFGKYVMDGASSVASGYINASNKAMSEENKDKLVAEWEEKWSPIDMSTVSSALEENDWKTIHTVSKINKVSTAGWKIGDTKTLQINGQTRAATLIGINHDGNNTTTWMVTDSIANRAMNTEWNNIGGWVASEMYTWLNESVYESMSNKEYIKPVDKISNGGNINNTEIYTSTDKLFLLSAKEVGLTCPYWYNDYVDTFYAEGTTYKWFANGGYINNYFWLRSSDFNSDTSFMACEYGEISFGWSPDELAVCPVFVIG